MQAGIQVQVAPDAVVAGASDLLNDIAGAGRRLKNSPVLVVAQPAKHEEPAIGIADIDRGHGRGTVEQGLHERQAALLVFETGFVDEVVTAQQVNRHPGRRHETGEIAQDFAMDAVRQVMGGFAQYLPRQAITDTAKNPADQQQQDQENGRNVYLQGKTTFHGAGPGDEQHPS